jgi:trehalose synthase-fused probable maltokinase
MTASADTNETLAKLGATGLTEERLGEWISEQRWYAAKAQETCQVTIIDVVALDEDELDALILLLVEVRAVAGTHDIYQLLIGVDRRPGGSDHARTEIYRDAQVVLFDGLSDERQGARIGRLIAADESIASGPTTVAFRRAGGLALSTHPQARVIGSEQSNSSVVLDEAHIVKAFRRIEPGINPELEMLRFLDHHGFTNMVPAEGWYDYRGELLEASLGLMQRYIGEARDGWQLVLERLEQGRSSELTSALRDLGLATGSMHTVLGSDGKDPEFAPEPPADEQVALLTATIDEQIERLFLDLPRREELEPVIARAEELRDRLSMLSHTGAGGRLIRIHGDYHLGQALLTPTGWVVIDFEGEPGRPLRERRRKRSPLRDVAGMLRSISYARLVSEVLRGVEVPDEFESEARDAFLGGYMERSDPALLPAGAQAIAKLLAMFELEKVIYELRYEVQNRPEWVAVPVRGITRLLDQQYDFD